MWGPTKGKRREFETAMLFDDFKIDPIMWLIRAYDTILINKAR